jgi:CHAD domain-containing protein
MDLNLSSEELVTLKWIAAEGRETHVRRARLLLLRDQGMPVRGIATRVGLSRTQVYTWLHTFREKRLSVFPADLLAAAARERPGEAAGERRRQRAAPDVLRDDRLSEAGRKVLRFHFERMLRHEPGTREGEDIEELHDMRVATRRMRSAFRVFAPYFEPDVLRPFLKGLRRTGRALGRVRDLDVIMDKAGDYLKSQPSGDRPDLTPLLAEWQRQRAAARTDLLAYLDGKRYRRFVERFGQFLNTPGAGALPPPAERPAPQQVHQSAPILIYSRYDVVLAYEPILDDAPLETLHALRIDCKLLRYTMEFFRRVLGPEVEDAIREVVTVQDHLGNLNDSDVASRLLIGFLDEWSTAEGRERIDIRGVIRYLADRQNALHELLAGFPDVWRHFTRPEMQRLLALAVTPL